jgi:PadR family transcriptional regulator PadR
MKVLRGVSALPAAVALALWKEIDTPPRPWQARHSQSMPTDAGLPPGTLVMLILRVLNAEPLHGYAIAQRIHQLSNEELQVEEGSLYPALQKLLVKGWVKADWKMSDTGRRVRVYRLTPGGRKQLDVELAEFRRTTRAIEFLLERA